MILEMKLSSLKILRAAFATATKLKNAHIVHMSVFLFTVPPAKPIIYDAKRRDMSKLLEAYPEGADLFLVCEVHGGKCQT